MTNATGTHTIMTPGARTIAESRRLTINNKPVTAEITTTHITIFVGTKIVHTAPAANLNSIAAVADYVTANITTDENGVTVEPSRRDTRLRIKYEGTSVRTIIQDAAPYDIITKRHPTGSYTCMHCYSASTTTAANYTWESYRPANNLSRARIDQISVCAIHAKRIIANGR